MPNLALITGASSGIGREFARYHAKKGGDLIILARNEDALHALKAELEEAHGVTVHVLVWDLGAPGAAEALPERLDADGHRIDVLINNAGFGGQGAHIDRDLGEEQAIIDLNVKALVTLCHRIGGAMARNGGGRILNVGSTAGFMPGPNQAVYFATKAFVNSFSQALDEELRPRGVTCTVLTPGYVQTGFADRADLHGTGLVRQKGKTAAQTAKIGYDAMRTGQLVAQNQPELGFFLRFIVPFVPRRLLLAQIRKLQAK